MAPFPGSQSTSCRSTKDTGCVALTCTQCRSADFGWILRSLGGSTSGESKLHGSNFIKRGFQVAPPARRIMRIAFHSKPARFVHHKFYTSLNFGAIKPGLCD